MESKKIMRGFEESFIQKVKESVSPISAVLEFIDNSIDAKAKNINITYKNNRLVITDDGKGMSITSLKKWCSNVISHTSIGKNTIGLRGIGSKTGFIALADLYSHTFVNVELISKVEGKSANRVVWTMTKSGQQETDNNEYTQMTNCGTTIIVNKCVELDINTIKDTITNTYSRFKNKIKITLNNEVITFFDRCYLDLLGKDVNNDGVYYKDGIAFIVKTYNATNVKEMSTLTLKAVHIYVTRLMEPSSNGHYYKNGGVYCLFNNRYINYGNNLTDMFSRGTGARGGLNGVRTLLFIDSDNCNIMDVKSDKNIGITNLKENLSLKNYILDDADDKINIFNAIQTDFLYLRRLVEYESKGTGRKKEYNVLTTEIISHIFNGGSVTNRKKREVFVVNSVDDLEVLIPELKTNGSPKIKEILYYVHNSLISEMKISRTKADKYVKDFWNKFYCNNVYNKTA